MKQLFLAVCLLFAALSNTFAADDPSENIEEAQGIIDIHPCRDKHVGVELLCNRKWPQEVEPNAVMMIISSDPAVLLTVAKAKEPITGIEELTQSRLKAIGQYAEGFKAERVKVDGNEAIRVEGFANEYPEMRLLDFYVIHDYTLYSFLFSVNPKEEWDTYAVLIGKIAQSIKIPDRKP
jgi:hypothetical protein